MEQSAIIRIFLCLITKYLTSSFSSLSFLVCHVTAKIYFFLATIVFYVLFFSEIVPGIRPDSTSRLGGHGGKRLWSWYDMYSTLLHAF